MKKNPRKRLVVNSENVRILVLPPLALREVNGGKTSATNTQEQKKLTLHEP